MKKHTFPGEQEEMPVRPGRPEVTQPADPKEPELPNQEIPEIPQELPPDEEKVAERPPQKDD
jgi:hypothetical protein